MYDGATNLYPSTEWPQLDREAQHDGPPRGRRCGRERNDRPHNDQVDRSHGLPHCKEPSRNLARSCPESKRSLASPGIGRWARAWAVAFGVVLAGCEPSNTVKSGPPVILSFGLVDATGSPVELTSEAGVVAASPLVHFVATFDRLLDAASLEDEAGVP